MKKDINKLAIKLKKEFQKNILSRYDNSEYWDNKILDDFCQDNNIEFVEYKELTKILDM